MLFESIWLRLQLSQRTWAKHIHTWSDSLDGNSFIAPIRAVLLGFAFWLLLFVELAATPACEPAKPIEQPENPAIYEFELTQCTANSDTLTASILCENEVRARHKRPPRKLPKPLPDGGVR